MQTLRFQSFLAPVKPASNLDGTCSTMRFQAYGETGYPCLGMNGLK